MWHRRAQAELRFAGAPHERWLAWQVPGGCTTRLVLRHHLGHGHRVRRASGALRPAHRAATAAAIVVDWWLDQHRWHRQRWLRPECVEIFAVSRPQPLPEEYLNET